MSGNPREEYPTDEGLHWNRSEWANTQKPRESKGFGTGEALVILAIICMFVLGGGSYAVAEDISQTELDYNIFKYVVPSLLGAMGFSTAGALALFHSANNNQQK